MLRHNLILAILYGPPVHLHAFDIFDAMLLRGLEVIINFSVEEEAFRRDTAYVQAGSAELRVFFNEGNL